MINNNGVLDPETEKVENGDVLFQTDELMIDVWRGPEEEDEE